MTAQEQLRALVRKHQVTIREQVETIGRALSELGDAGVEQPSLVAKAAEISHQIKGGSGSLGFGEVSAAAARLDDHLKTFKPGGNCFDTAGLQASLDLFDKLQKAARDAAPEKSALYNIDLSQLAR